MPVSGAMTARASSRRRRLRRRPSAPAGAPVAPTRRPAGLRGRPRRGLERRPRPIADRLAQHQRRLAGLDLELGELARRAACSSRSISPSELAGVAGALGGLAGCARARSRVPPAEDQRGVLAAEPERVRRAPPGVARAAPAAASGRGRRPRRRGRSRLSVGGTQPSRIARIVARHRSRRRRRGVWPIIALGGGDRDAAGACSPKSVRNAWQLGRVAFGRGRGVGVDVVDLGRVDAGLLERPARGADRARAARRGQRDVGRVGGRAVADSSARICAPRACGVLELLEHEHAGALRDDEAVAALVERAGGRLPGRRCASTARASPRSRRRAPRGSRASVPPASIMSASPRRIVSVASPIAWPPVAQARHGRVVGAQRRRS